MIESITTAREEVEALSSPLVLPSGVKLPNRLVKAAMEEMLGSLGGGDPSDAHCVLYEEWAKGNWGMIITGNIMVSSTHLGTPADIIVPFATSASYGQSLRAFKSWSKASKSHSSLAPVIVQLCHTGRQSMRGSGRNLFEPNLAPSSVPVNAGNSLIAKGFSRIVWGTPREMKEKDFDEVVEGFLQGARVAKECGFDGVQLHGSHGYLLAQMLSLNVNLRTDSYGGSPRGRTKLMFRILDAIRKEFPLSSGFCVGIKLNSSDYVKGGLTEKDALDNVRWIAEHGGMDFIEISGGTYENAAMLGDKPPTDNPASTTPTVLVPSNREAFFLSFASSAQTLLQSLDSSSLPSPAPVILVTGGFRTRKGMSSAIISNSTALVGIGRPACADPLLPLTLLNPSVENAKSPIYTIKGIKWLKLLPIGIVGPGLSTVWHTMLLALISRKEKIDLEMSFFYGFWKVWGRLVVEKYWTWFGLMAVLVWSVGTRYFL